MKQNTKDAKKLYLDTLSAMYDRNNSRWEKQTDEQRKQSRIDKLTAVLEQINAFQPETTKGYSYRYLAHRLAAGMLADIKGGKANVY